METLLSAPALQSEGLGVMQPLQPPPDRGGKLQRARKIKRKDTKAGLGVLLLSFTDWFAKLHWAKPNF